MNDSVITSSEKNSAGPTSTDASVTRLQRSRSVGWRWCCVSNASRCLCAFSMNTMAASTMAPSAIAMPPRLRMLALTPCQCITMNAASSPTGNVITATRAERRWNKKITHTSATTMNSSTSLSRRLSTARSMSKERSYVVTTSTPGGRLALSAASLALTASMVVRAFLPERITTTPPATSPSPSSSAIPWRISGPICTKATSLSITGVAPDTDTAIARKSSSDFKKPRERTMYCVSASSTTEPPAD